ncbi:MAG: glutamate--tRNA ligase [Candidatus Thorarchaeota archaeon]
MSQDLIDQAKELILKYSLENAVNFNGKASEKSVMQKIMASHAELRKLAKELGIIVESTVATVNNMSEEAQLEQLEEIAPELLEKKASGKRIRDLPPLKDAIEGKVVTRYAPEPNGEMHFGHAFTAYIASYYAKKYNGTFILRFEDTNPKQEKVEYMEAHKEALAWLDIYPDKVVIVSNDLPIFYEKAEELINNNHAYTCTCSVEKMRDLRGDMISCEHSAKTSEETMAEWKKMIAGEYNEGEIVLRLRGDMESQNAVMRDPAIFSIRKDKHCLQGTKYKVWPLYDFAVAIEDNLCGVTHVGRSAEFDTRIELQNKIRELLGLLPHPLIFHYARFNVTGSPASKRQIIPLVKEGKVEGWDDIRLVTIKGMRRRGIVPETIKQITKEVGMSNQPTNVDWSLIAATNRKIIDHEVSRYFFVPDPVLVFVENAPVKRTATVPYHPSNPEKGERKINSSDLFLISKEDYESFKINDEFRLKDLYNIKLTKKKITLEKILEKHPDFSDDQLEFLKSIPIICQANYTDDELKSGSKIQWVPASLKDIIPVQVKVPDVLFIDDVFNENSLTLVNGYGEKSITKMVVGDLAQFERYGFIRVDRKTKEKIYVNYAHK